MTESAKAIRFSSTGQHFLCGHHIQKGKYMSDSNDEQRHLNLVEGGEKTTLPDDEIGQGFAIPQGMEQMFNPTRTLNIEVELPALPGKPGPGPTVTLDHESDSTSGHTRVEVQGEPRTPEEYDAVISVIKSQIQ